MHALRVFPRYWSATVVDAAGKHRRRGVSLLLRRFQGPKRARVGGRGNEWVERLSRRLVHTGRISRDFFRCRQVGVY
jgi:hypothetical protein